MKKQNFLDKGVLSERLLLLSDLPEKDYKRIYGRMQLGHITKHIIDGAVYYDPIEVANWKPKRRGKRAEKKE